MYCVDCGEGQTVLRLNSTKREVIVASHLEATDLMSVQELPTLSCICTLPFTWTKGPCVSQSMGFIVKRFHDFLPNAGLHLRLRRDYCRVRHSKSLEE